MFFNRSFKNRRIAELGSSTEGLNFAGEDASIHGLILNLVSHRIHGAGIYANIWGILMVNVTIYSIHGSYGLWLV
jgi:hypothetical protein